MEEKLQQFIRLVETENRKHNLVSRRTTPEELWQHIEDSRQVLAWEELKGLELIDIGSGAGFPGLVLAICCPTCQVTLVESDLKKSGFLILASKELELDNVLVIRDRAESLGRDPLYRQRFDVCSSRAVASMRVVLEYALPLIKLDRAAWLWKGSNYQQEIDEAQTALKLLGGTVEKVYRYSLVGENDRSIVVVRKTASTPANYPRRTGLPAKKPI